MYSKSTRRDILKYWASGTVIGALGSLYSGSILAAGHEPRPGPRVGGSVIRKGDSDYESWRRSMVFHRSKPDRYPDMIVQATSVEDVQAAVRYAADNNLKVTTRSGGHNALGASLRDGGVCIDVSPLNDVQIDDDRQLALTQPGTKGIQLTAQAGARGFSFPVPHCPTVGIGGFVLGGGIGLNYTARDGFAALSIEGAEIVTADGEIVMATRDENPDLYWAVRGGGPGFFGVVTRYDLKLYPTAQGILANTYILPLEELEAATQALDQLHEGKDDRVEIMAALMHSPVAPPDAPPEQSKIFIVTAYAFGDTVAESRDLLRPLARSILPRKSIALVEYEKLDFPGLYKFFTPDTPGGAHGRYGVDGVLTNEPGKIFVDVADHFRSTPSPINHVLGAYGMNLETRDDSCLSWNARHYVGAFIIWQDETQDDANFDWLDGAIPHLERYQAGRYINEVELRRHPTHIRECFTEENWRKLADARKKYDPNGVFHGYLGQV
ncbi:MAG: FAD-binding oxidoreductase [Gammaproteobacteria bacterium]|nr:FAD-binding oxidoreductase [Gammaproteobacteria bacterium]